MALIILVLKLTDVLLNLNIFNYSAINFFLYIDMLILFSYTYNLYNLLVMYSSLKLYYFKFLSITKFY